MSKPEKPGELRNVNVDSISLVSEAANRKTYRILKMDKSAMNQSAATGGEAPNSAAAPETVTKGERGLIRVLKGLFMGEEVEKGAVANAVKAKNSGRRLGEATDALFTVLNLNRWGDGAEEAETNPAKIRAALTDFKNVAEDILIGKDEDVEKAVQEIQKSGRKISAPRLSKIKEAYAMLGDLIADADTENTEGEASEVTKEELTQVVKQSMEEAVKPLNERLAALEKGEAQPQPDTKNEPQGEAQDIAKVVKDAVAEAVTSLNERITKIEKARGLSNRQPEETGVQKSADDLWDGLF